MTKHKPHELSPFKILLRIAAGDSPATIPALLVEQKLVRAYVGRTATDTNKVYADWQITAKGWQFIDTYKTLEKQAPDN